MATKSRLRIGPRPTVDRPRRPLKYIGQRYRPKESAIRIVIRAWSNVGFLVRMGIVVLTGVTWAASGAQGILVRVDYWDPVTTADFFAVYAYSAALLLTAASLLPLRGVARPTVPGSPSTISSWRPRVL
jgi:hypothetical protein